MYLIYNGTPCPLDDFRISFNNRGFQYGDGIFETMIAENNAVNYLTDHLDRLKNAMTAFSLESNENFNETLSSQIYHLLKINNQSEARIKIIVWRTGEGLFVPDDNDTDYIITSIPLKRPPALKNSVDFFQDARLGKHPLSPYKTLNCLPYVLAGLEKKKTGMDDLVLLSHEGYVAECISSNIFFEKDGAIFTPSIETGCKEGIMKKQIKKICAKEGIRFEEVLWKQEELFDADLIFTGNVATLSLITNVAHKSFLSSSPLYSLIKESLEN
ncbi:MAG TPA: aminotransferase class IV [Cytophagaceae bacterium]